MIMYKTIITATAAIALLIVSTFPVSSQEVFYSHKADLWDITGTPSTGAKNAVCEAKYVFRDGSAFALYSDLIDGELYVIIYNVTWNLPPKQPGSPTASLRMNFHAANGAFVEGKKANYLTLSKNVIAIPMILPEAFLPPFIAHDKLEVIMPDDIPNATIPLKGSSDALSSLTRCIKSAGKQSPPKKQTDT
jgi:hypothetical protein